MSRTKSIEVEVDLDVFDFDDLIEYINDNGGVAYNKDDVDEDVLATVLRDLGYVVIDTAYVKRDPRDNVRDIANLLKELPEGIVSEVLYEYTGCGHHKNTSDMCKELAERIR